jgi:hypothetical protein
MALLVAACAATTPSPTPSSGASPSAGSDSPTATGGATPVRPTAAPSAATSPEPLVWEEYHSDDLGFSLQLPRGWSARRTGTAQGDVLRASADGAGSLLVVLELLEQQVPFEQFVRESFRTLLEADPNAVQPVTLAGGRAARAVSPRDDGGVSIIYLFAPRADHVKSLSFTWESAEPHPIWHAIAERFNPYGTQPIIPFITPSP